jgi:hypothetical protein
VIKYDQTITSQQQDMSDVPDISAIPNMSDVMSDLKTHDGEDEEAMILDLR